MLDRKNTLRFLVLAWALPAVLSYFIYFAYSNGYSGDVFHPEGFAAIYDNGIFKYRVVGKHLLIAVHDAIVAWNLPVKEPLFYQAIHPATTGEWYTAFFYLNVFFLCATMSVFFVITEKLNKTGDHFFSDMCLIILMGVMVISQYVIVPYDMISYLFIALSTYLILFHSGVAWAFISLCVVLVLGVLTRETAALILSFYAAVHHRELLRFPPRLTENGKPTHFLHLAILTALFVATYAILRTTIDTDQPFYKSVRFDHNMESQISNFGLIYFIIVTVALTIPAAARKVVVAYLITSAPYVIIILLVSSPREIRIWAPMLLPMLLLQFQASLDRVKPG